MEDALLQMTSITKSFNGVEVLHDVSLRLESEVLGLVGKNGAGKSTLMKILFGVEKADAGKITVFGHEYNAARLDLQRSKNIAMIFQELSLIPTLSVAENIFLSNLPRTWAGLIDRQACREAAARTLRAMGVQVDPDARVESLSVAERQSVEIAKAIAEQRRILIMDEPTAALSADQVSSLFRLIRDLKSKGIAIIYISHNLRELFQVCDRITILKDGRNVLTCIAKETTLQAVIAGITGATAAASAYEDSGNGRATAEPHVGNPEVRPLIRIKGVSLMGKLKDVSFSVYPGEVVGVAGLTGSGRTELMEAVFGAGRFDAGTIHVDETLVRDPSPTRSIRLGLILIPDDRQTKGLITNHSVRSNMTLPILNALRKFGFISSRKERIESESLMRRLNVVAASAEQKVGSLSGGNQQKVVLSKAISTHSRILLLDDPTVGVDVESKQEILQMIRTLVSEERTAAILVCSELEMLAGVCDRVLVLRGGALVADLDKRTGDDISESHLLSLV